MHLRYVHYMELHLIRIGIVTEEAVDEAKLQKLVASQCAIGWQ